MHADSKGTTLIETLIASAFFLVFSLAIYQLYAKVVEVSTNIRMRTLATEVAGEQFELIRNLQYYDVGTVGGIPAGLVDPDQDVVRNGVTFSVITTIRNVDHPVDGTVGGTPGDLSPADNKLVEVVVTCTTCKDQISINFTSWIAPKSLETENGNGALVIRAIDANGQPIYGAEVSIVNNSLSPAVDINDVTDFSGALTIVDAPPSTENYQITVTKDGYSTESSFLPGAPSNPNPVKPHLTVSANTVTQSTFSIDRQSTFNITTQNTSCLAIGGISGTFTGTKLIGTNPDVLKNIYNFSTDAGGVDTLSSIEWDTYTTALNGTSYDLIGINPLQPISVPPGSIQNIAIILRSANPNTLLAIITDAATGLPLSGASVRVEGGSTDITKVTNIGSLTQTDWSGGGTQANYVDTSKFFSSDGGIDYSTTAGQIRLLQVGGFYSSSGSLISSVIDLGSSATFHQLSWSPATQPPATGSNPVRFQIATANTNNEETIWDFLGPDGTSATFYTTNLSDISSVHDGNRFVRYKIYLSTLDNTSTPTISDISFTFTSGCLPPGQIDFGGLSDNTYTITVTKDGYATDSKDITINNDEFITFSLSPS